MTLQFFLQTLTVLRKRDSVFLLHAKTIAEEVRIFESKGLTSQHNCLVNFSVVSGGAALLVASQLAGTGILSPGLGAMIFGKTL